MAKKKKREKNPKSTKEAGHAVHQSMMSIEDAIDGLKLAEKVGLGKRDKKQARRVRGKLEGAWRKIQGIAV